MHPSRVWQIEKEAETEAGSSLALLAAISRLATQTLPTIIAHGFLVLGCIALVLKPKSKCESVRRTTFIRSSANKRVRKPCPSIQWVVYVVVLYVASVG